MSINLDEAMLCFFKNDLGGNRVTNAAGEVLYEDDRSAFVSRETTNWAVACPPPREGQRGELWDLLRRENKSTYMVTTSTITVDSEMLQIHHIVDASLYMNLVQDVTDYSRTMREEAEQLRRKWEDGLAELNRKPDGVNCVIACGMACGEKGYDLEAVLAEADQRMYEDKKAKKGGALPR